MIACKMSAWLRAGDPTCAWHRVLTALFVCGMTGMSTPDGAAQSAAATTPAPIANDGPAPLTAWEVVSLFAGNTWKWGDGGAYFRDKPRHFIAYVASDGTKSIASGIWTVSDAGVLCLTGIWRSANWSKKSQSCYGHTRDGDSVVQTKEPDGKPYVLYSRTSASGNNPSQLVTGDKIRAKYDAVAEALAKSQANRQSD